MLRKTTTALSVLALVMVGSVAVAPSANALSGGTYCFKYAKMGTAYANQPVLIQLSDDNANWVTAMTAETAPNGCGGFTLWGTWTQKYVRAVAERKAVGPLKTGIVAVWSGTTPLVGSPGSWTADLGTGGVYCTTKTVYACVGF